MGVSYFIIGESCGEVRPGVYVRLGYWWSNNMSFVVYPSSIVVVVGVVALAGVWQTFGVGWVSSFR